MALLNINQVDDFLEVVRPKYELRNWADISMSLQEYYFASRLFDKAGADEMAGDKVTWRLQIANNSNFSFTGLYADDVTSRKTLLTDGEMSWSISTTNFTYDILEILFKTSDVEIIDYMVTLEHSMYNDYFGGMEMAMFGAGPTAIGQAKPPPASILWWLQYYNQNSSELSSTYAATLTAGGTPSSTFGGMSPSGFETIGPGSVDPKTYSGWRNRVGVYATVSQDDFVDTFIECVDKSSFKNPHSYPALVGKRPNREALTTYEVVKRARKLLQDGNDNIRNALDTYKIDAPMIRSIPLVWVPAWSNQDFGLTRTDGLCAIVDWSTFKYLGREGLRMQKGPAIRDPGKHNVRWRHMDDSGQIVCYDRRRNSIMTCSNTVTESN